MYNILLRFPSAQTRLGRFIRNPSVSGVLEFPLRLITYPLIMPIMQGPLSGKFWISKSGSPRYWLGMYELPKQVKFCNFLSLGNTVYDIGANVGFYTLLASELVGITGKVYSFEPSPKNISFLYKNMEINKVKNAHILELAIGERVGKAGFKDDGIAGSLSDEGDLMVTVETLDHLVEKQVIRPPNLIKIDVEGAEENVILGGEKIISRYRPILLIATHGQSVHNRVVKQLEKWDYTVTGLNGERQNQTTELIALPVEYKGFKPDGYRARR